MHDTSYISFYVFVYGVAYALLLQIYLFLSVKVEFHNLLIRQNEMLSMFKTDENGYL